MSSAQPPLPGAVTLATFPSSKESLGVQLELVRILNIEEKILLKRDLGFDLPSSTMDNWEQRRNALLAMRFVEPRGGRLYHSWIEIMTHGAAGHAYKHPIAKYLGTNSKVPLHIQEAAGGPLLGFRVRDAWIWTVLDLLGIQMTHEVSVHLGLPLIADPDIELPAEPTRSSQQTTQIAFLIGMGSKIFGRPYMKQTYVGTWSSKLSSPFPNLRSDKQYVTIQVHGGTTDYVENPRFILMRKEDIKKEGANQGTTTGDANLHFAVSFYAFPGSEPFFHYWPGDPSPFQAALNADMLVAAGKWDEWLDTHTLVGTPVFDPTIYEALNLPSPMLGPPEDLVQMIQVMEEQDG